MIKIDHMKSDMILLGYTSPFVHSLIDSASDYLGPAHRYDDHDMETVEMIGDKFGIKRRNIALLHLLLDFHMLDDKLVMKIIKEKTVK